MKSIQDTGLTFINARMSGVDATTLRVVGSEIAAIGGEPEAGDRVIDLHGDRLLPGLINAHDHLQLNSLPPLPSTKRYRHVHEWILEVDALKHIDAVFQAKAAAPREGRLLAGGLKNLLSGVTTVAHHDPLYPTLTSADFPVHVVERYGWSHSLYLDGEEKVRNSYSSTPREWPWIVHAAEGVDLRAAEEFERLDALGCLGANTLIVHGIALDSNRRRRLIEAGAGLIWCPSSNLRLFGETADVAELIAHQRVALATDSRLSGAADLLHELRIAGATAGLDEQILESLVTERAAKLLRLTDRGALRIGARADLLVLSSGSLLTQASRADVRLVLLDGVARYGEEDYVRASASDSSTQWTPVRIDGFAKLLDSNIAARLAEANVQEPGFYFLDFPNAGWRAA